MSDLISPSLSMPLIAPAQAQKHVTHNEAVMQLDAVVQLRLEAIDIDMPPATAEPGQCFALGAAPQGEWAGRAGLIAVRELSAWRFVAPQEGWQAWSAQDGILVVRVADTWQSAVAADSLPGLGINASYDSTNRLVVAGDASLLSHAGADHRLKVNRAGSADTASLLFQTDYTGGGRDGACR